MGTKNKTVVTTCRYKVVKAYITVVIYNEHGQGGGGGGSV